MKHISAFCLLLFFTGVSLNAIGFNLINLPAVNGIYEVEEEVLFLMNEEWHLENYYPDQYWDFELTKEEYTEKLAYVIRELESHEQDKYNQDYNLLMGLLYFYLYNLDYPDSFDRFEEYLTGIDSFPQKDYRFKWFLGSMYCKALQPYKGIREFEGIREQVPEEALHPWFWDDYAQSLMMAFMPGSSRIGFELYSRYADVSLKENNFYQNLKDSFVDRSPDEEITEKDLYTFLEREDGRGIISYPFEIWLPMKEDWEIRLLPYQNRMSGVICKSTPLFDEFGNEITYSVLSLFYVEGENILKKQLEGIRHSEKAELPGINPGFEIYEISDPDQYSQIGGARGYIAFYKGSSTDRSYSFEAPSMIDTSGMTESYVPLGEKINRLSENISYMFMLDSCENIFDESRADFIDFLNRVKVE